MVPDRPMPGMELGPAAEAVRLPGCLNEQAIDFHLHAPYGSATLRPALTAGG